MRIFLLWGCLCIGILESFPVQALEREEKEKIFFLIEAVKKWEGVRFIRNGREYDGITAAEHLRRKWQAASERVKTAEDFIRFCASFSSRSGQPYRIRFADGKEVEAGPFFRRLLIAYSAPRAPAS